MECVNFVFVLILKQTLQKDYAKFKVNPKQVLFLISILQVPFKVLIIRVQLAPVGRVFCYEFNPVVPAPPEFAEN